MPGVFGGLVVVAFVASPLWQLAGIAVTVVLAITMGVVVGFIVSRLGRKQNSYDDKDEFFTSEEKENDLKPA